jgi:hypothetical protein
MNKTWTTHLPHLLDESGNPPIDVSLSAKQLTKAMCAFVAYATNFAGEDDEELPSCFVTVQTKRCQGKVLALPMVEDDNSRVRNWRVDVYTLRFQSLPHQTQLADLPHYAFLIASC